jgi:hypothetical protein
MRDKRQARRPDKALMRRRVEEVLRIRLDGAEFWDVCEFVREKESENGSAWHLAEGEKPLSRASLRRYLTRADALIVESFRATRRRLRRRHLAQRNRLYAKAVAQGDLRAALAALKDEAELLGLYPSPERELLKQVQELRRALAEQEEARRATG